MAIVVQDPDLQNLCRELQSLGGGINTRLEQVSLLNLTKLNSDTEGIETPFLVHDGFTSRRLQTYELTSFLNEVSRFF